jgi:hypothetical protein
MGKLLLAMVIVWVLIMVGFDLLNLAPQLGPVFEILGAIIGVCIILVGVGWILGKRVFGERRDQSD